MWTANEGTNGLIALLPGKEEIFAYLDSFQRRVQGCSFPHVPDQCTRVEVDRFLANIEHNAILHPDMLALLFATLAQSVQHGVFDRSGGQWVSGVVENETKKGDVFGMY